MFEVIFGSFVVYLLYCLEMRKKKFNRMLLFSALNMQKSCFWNSFQSFLAMLQLSQLMQSYEKIFMYPTVQGNASIIRMHYNFLQMSKLNSRHKQIKVTSKFRVECRIRPDANFGALHGVYAYKRQNIKARLS